MKEGTVTIMICGDGETDGQWSKLTVSEEELQKKVTSGEW